MTNRSGVVECMGVVIWAWFEYGYGSVLHCGGGVQELGSDSCACEDALPDCVYDTL